MEWVVHFNWKHKGFFWFHQEVVFEASERILLINQISLYVLEMEQRDFHLKSMQIDEPGDPVHA